MTTTESDIRAACMKYMHDQIGPLCNEADRIACSGSSRKNMDFEIEGINL